eukprot:1923547-Alexandrium_andersonii.AAC.1
MLRKLQRIARGLGLELNKEKTVELAMHSDQRITFDDGTLAPRRDQTHYLGTTIAASSSADAE